MEKRESDKGKSWESNVSKVFMPHIDVFASGGRNALKQFGDKKDKKNLVVMPTTYLDDLARKSNSTDWIEADSAVDTLKYINSHKVVDPVDRVIDLGNNLLIKIEKEGNFEDVAKKFNEKYKKRFSVITNSPSVNIKFKFEKINVEHSNFDKLDPYLVNECMLDIDGSEVIAEYYNNESKDIPISKVETILGRKLFEPGGGPILRQKGSFLYYNQIIRLDRQNQVYGVVTGKPVRNIASERITDLEDVVLHVIGEQEKHNILSENYFGIKPKNLEQGIALNYIVSNDNIQMAMIVGGQGSGKTILTYGAALRMLLVQGGYKSKEKKYETIRLIKADNALGNRDMGFLPGTAYEKNINIFKSFEIAHDFTNLGINFEIMLQDPRGASKDFIKRESHKTGIDNVYLPSKKPAITFDYSLFARGVTWGREIVFCDEFQNFTQREGRDLVGRLGVGTKGILAGDIEQVDNPKNSPEDNALLGALNEFLGRPYFAVIKLEENFRSIMSDHSRYWKVYK